MSSTLSWSISKEAYAGPGRHLFPWSCGLLDAVTICIGTHLLDGEHIHAVDLYAGRIVATRVEC